MSFEHQLAMVGRAIDRSIESKSGRVRIGVGLAVLICLLAVSAWRMWPSRSTTAEDLANAQKLRSMAEQQDSRRTEYSPPQPVRANPMRPAARPSK